MASLSVRKIEDGVYERLRARAKHHGVSMEEEVRRIIRHAVTPPERLGELALQYFGPTHGVDLQPPPPEPHDPLDLDR